MKKVEILKGYEALELIGKDQVEGVRIKNRTDDSKSRLDISGIFVEVGLLPNTGFIIDALDVNETGEILVNCQTETGAPGVFAAGDVTNVRDKYIVVAAGEGAKAALRANEYIMSKR
jgi:alkyl hydroperoxide reductase subunit F